MLFKTLSFAALALFSAQQAAGSPFEKPNILIATDAYDACNCPNNCDYHEGSSCRYYSGPSDSSPVLSGSCAYPNQNPGAGLTCKAQST